MGCGVLGVGCGVQGAGDLQLLVLGHFLQVQHHRVPLSSVSRFGFWVLGLAFGAWGLGFRVQGFGIRVTGFGFISKVDGEALFLD